MGQNNPVPRSTCIGLEQRNRAVTAVKNIATGAEQIGLKALAQKVLQRNTTRNVAGTGGVSPTRNLWCSTQQEHTHLDVIVERIAIAQFDAGIPREWVEGYAQLQTMALPASMPPEYWQRIINDAGLFLDRWAVKATALGWTSLDLFGVHPERPYGAVHYAGLVSLIQGRPVIAITANTAIIDCGQDIHHTYMRCPPKPGQVKLWELQP